MFSNPVDILCVQTLRFAFTGADGKLYLSSIKVACKAAVLSKQTLKRIENFDPHPLVTLFRATLTFIGLVPRKFFNILCTNFNALTRCVYSSNNDHVNIVNPEPKLNGKGRLTEIHK